jgi:hypothetical protein
MIAQENIYVNGDRSKVVPADDKDASFLLVAKGQAIPDPVAAKYQLKGEVEKPAEEPKQPGPSGVHIAGRSTRVPNVPHKR